MSMNKIIVIDANILIRAVLGQKVRELIQHFAPTTQFFTPAFCYGEAAKYLPLLISKRNLPPEDALDVLGGVTCLIQVVDDKQLGLINDELLYMLATNY